MPTSAFRQFFLRLAGNPPDGYAVLLRCGIGSRSVFGFEDDDDARRFGFVRPQTRQSRIAPARKTDNFTSLTFHFRRFSGLQHVETAAVEKEGMIPKQVVQLGNRGMAIGKNLGIELAQGLVHLRRVQLHGLLLFCLQLVWGCSVLRWLGFTSPLPSAGNDCAEVTFPDGLIKIS